MLFSRAAGLLLCFAATSLSLFAQAPVMGRCSPVSLRQSPTQEGCWILADDKLPELGNGEIFWHLDRFDSRASALSAKGTRGSVVEALGKVWLLTIAPRDWTSAAGTHVATIGPLPISPGKQYSAQYMEAVTNPGWTSEIHKHAGPEAWYTEGGETCLETASGVMRGAPGSAPVIVPGDTPMFLTATGSEQRRAVVLVLHESDQPAGIMLPNGWKPKGLCSQASSVQTVPVAITLQPASPQQAQGGQAAGRAPAPNPNPTEVAGIPVNYNESKVGSYTLPDPLVLANGKPVRDAKTWMTQRRPELVRLFEENQYGRAPGRPEDMSFDVFDKGSPALNGTAIRRQVMIYFSKDKNGPKMDLLVYLPAQAKKPVPLLLNLSFAANSSTVDDPGIKPGEVWGREKKRVPAPKNSAFGRLNVAPFLAAGIGVATVYYGDIDPDFLGGAQLGVRGRYLKAGQTEPAPDEWGAIAAWAWGLSRAMDYLETDKGVDAKRVAILGISRLGKTVMWAGAHDTRFAAVIASCSGEGGAALSRRNFGETVAHLVAPSRYPYQFAGNYPKYAEHVDQLPVDAHELVALIAPRPVLLQTGNRDLWSDPHGEFLAAVAAGPVFKLLGKQDLGTDQWPGPGEGIFHTVSYYMHDGGHGTVPSDWPVFLKFLQANLQP